MNLLQVLTDSISVSLNPSILIGEKIQFLISVNNGSYALSDTITKYFGMPTNLLVDNCNNTNNWTPNLWGITNSDFQSSPSSISDSPFGNYNDYENNEIILANNINLNGLSSAMLSFYTKWDLEKFYDYVQVLASTNNGGSWVPLCGKHSRSASTFQAFGEPIYDGTQVNWIKEEIDLSDFIGHQVKLKFVLISDSQVNFDGFYFDDVTIQTYSGSNSIETNNLEEDLDIYPNPSNGEINIQFNFSKRNISNITIINSFGQKVFSEDIDNNTKSSKVDVSKWSKGMYFIMVTSSDSKIITKKVTIN